jgi:hypothetical protein
MSWLRVLASRLFTKHRVEHKLDEELRAHRDAHHRENRRNGMNPEKVRFMLRGGQSGLSRRRRFIASVAACRWLTPLSGTFGMASTCYTGRWHSWGWLC